MASHHVSQVVHSQIVSVLPLGVFYVMGGDQLQILLPDLLSLHLIQLKRKLEKKKTLQSYSYSI